MTPLFIFSAAPHQKVSFRDFFGRQDVRALLETPGELRYAGWDLTTHDQVRLGPRQCLQVGLGERKLLQLYEDGTFLVRAAADGSYLAWGESGKENAFRLNPIAVVEFTYNFVRLYQRLGALLDTAPETLQVGIRVEHAWLGGQSEPKLWLTPYGVNTFEWMTASHRRDAPDARVALSIVVPWEVLATNAERAAFLLLEQLYLWFGFTSEQIPYSEVRDGERIVSADSIVGKKRT